MFGCKPHGVTSRCVWVLIPSQWGAGARKPVGLFISTSENQPSFNGI